MTCNLFKYENFVIRSKPVITCGSSCTDQIQFKSKHNYYNDNSLSFKHHHDDDKYALKWYFLEHHDDCD